LLFHKQFLIPSREQAEFSLQTRLFDVTMEEVFPMQEHVVTLTYIGGPTAMPELGSLRLLTDPTFDPPGAIAGHLRSLLWQRDCADQNRAK
jgi:hypothetical protein